MTLDELKVQFEEDIKISEEMIDRQIISIPKIMAKYIFFYSDTLKDMSNISCEKDELFYSFMIEYRGGKTDISQFTWNATELKKMIETSPRFMELTRKELELQSNLKVVEEMISNIKSIGYSMNNYISYKKLMNGVI